MQVTYLTANEPPVVDYIDAFAMHKRILDHVPPDSSPTSRLRWFKRSRPSTKDRVFSSSVYREMYLSVWVPTETLIECMNGMDTVSLHDACTDTRSPTTFAPVP